MEIFKNPVTGKVDASYKLRISDRIFIALRSQFTKFKYKVHHYSFTRTDNQINLIY